MGIFRRTLCLFTVAGLLLSAAPLQLSRAQASSANKADSCCGSNGACCCGVAGGCGMCGDEKPQPKTARADDGELKLASCPGPAQTASAPAFLQKGIVPSLVAIAAITLIEILPACNGPSFHSRSVSPPVPPPRD